jgi:hypothetical protein
MQAVVNKVNPSGIIDPMINPVNEPVDLREHSFYYMIMLVTNRLNSYNDDIIDGVVKPLEDIRKVIDDMNHLQDIINKLKQSQTDPTKAPPSPEDIENAKQFAAAMKQLKKDTDQFYTDYHPKGKDSDPVNPEFAKLSEYCEKVYDMVHDQQCDDFSTHKMDKIGQYIDIINSDKATPEEKAEAAKLLAINFNVWSWVNQGKFDTKDPVWKNYGKEGDHDIFYQWLERGNATDDYRPISTFISLTLTGSENDLNNKLNEDLKKYDSIMSVCQKFVTNITDMCSFWLNKQAS